MRSSKFNVYDDKNKKNIINKLKEKKKRKEKEKLKVNHGNNEFMFFVVKSNYFL